MDADDEKVAVPQWLALLSTEVRARERPRSLLELCYSVPLMIAVNRRSSMRPIFSTSSRAMMRHTQWQRYRMLPRPGARPGTPAELVCGSLVRYRCPLNRLPSLSISLVLSYQSYGFKLWYAKCCGSVLIGQCTVYTT